jgi:flagellar hook-associated protein 3 FlgL
MRLANTTLSETLIGNIRQLSERQARLQGQVSTNQRVSSPSDDPAAARRVMMLESERRALAQYASNASRAREISQASFSGLQQLKKVADRSSEIATSASGVAGADQRAAYAAEINQLIEQAIQLGNSEFGGDHVFAGSATNTPPFTVARDGAGRATAVTYAGNSDRTVIAVGENASVAAGTSGDTNTGIRDVINQLISLRDGLDAADGSAISAANVALQAGGDQLVGALADQGAIQTRLDLQDSLRSEGNSRVENQVSAAVDSDLATVMVKLNQTSVAYQAALQSAATIMKTSLLDYLR